MRENLSRGKRKDNGEWVEGFHVKCRGIHYILPVYDRDNGFDERYADWVEVEPRTVGKYTGQTDRAGKDIFEDDIVEFDDDSGWFEEEPGLGVITWDEERVGFVISGERRIYGLDEIGGDIKVIGNPFDNPSMADW